MQRRIFEVARLGVNVIITFTLAVTVNLQPLTVNL